MNTLQTRPFEITWSARGRRPHTTWHTVTFHRPAAQSYDVSRDLPATRRGVLTTQMIPALIALWLETWRWSSLSCRGIWERGGSGEAGVEALHPSATCRSARVIHGSHFVSKSHHKSSLPWKGGRHSLCLETINAGISQMCVGDKENETEFKRCLVLNAFYVCWTHQLLFSPQSFNNSELEDRRRPCSLYLSRCLLP